MKPNKNLTLAGISALILMAMGSSVNAVTVRLFDYAFNIDGAVSEISLGDSIPSEADTSSFDALTGLGSISVTIGGVGSHYAALFIDHEIDEAINTFFNEWGSVHGVPDVGQSWEIDEPGYVFGDIYANFLAGSLSNSVGVSFPEDVSMALGWDFTLGAGESAEIEFLLSDMAPTSGFYLGHSDPDSDYSIYFSSSLTITSGVPDGGSTLSLLGLSCFTGFIARRTFRKTAK